MLFKMPPALILTQARSTGARLSSPPPPADIVYGNWNSDHRLYQQSRDASGTPTFQDVAPAAMAAPSPIRTVIVADWDNDGYEEIFFNNSALRCLESLRTQARSSRSRPNVSPPPPPHPHPRAGAAEGPARDSSRSTW